MLPEAPVLSAVLETALYVDNLDAAERFYGSILGLTLLQRLRDRHVFFQVGTSVLLLFDATETAMPTRNPHLPVPTHGAFGPGHLCFGLPRADSDQMRLRLVAAGVTIEAEFDWPNGAHSFYFRDPAGNSIEIADPWLWSVQKETQL